VLAEAWARAKRREADGPIWDASGTSLFVPTGHGWLGLSDPNRGWMGGKPRDDGRNEAGNREF